MDRDAVEVRVLGRDPSEIVPHARKDCSDLGRRLIGKCRRKISAPDAMLGEPRPHDPHKPTQKICHALAIDAAQNPEPPDRDPAKEAVLE